MNDKKGRHMTKDYLSGALSYKKPQYVTIFDYRDGRVTGNKNIFLD